MIYLDSAATTFQKPPAVETAMVDALRTMSSPGRGGYPAAMAAADAAFDCRSELAELYGLKNPEQVVFTLNATHALNIAVKTLVPPGGRVVISGGADIGRARLRTESGIPLQIGADTVTLPQFRLSARALRLRKMSLAAQDAARAAQDILDADCQWVTQIQAAYGALYRQLERGIGGFRSQRPEEAAGPIRGVQAAGALLSEMRQAIPRPESQAMSTHGRRGMEEARQLLG